MKTSQMCWIIVSIFVASYWAQKGYSTITAVFAACWFVLAIVGEWKGR